MASQRTDLLWAILSLVALLCGMAQAAGPSIPIKYCARANTGFDVNPDMFPLITDFQSEGRCFGNCTTAKKAFAIVLEKACWCSDLIPNKADQANIKDCSFPCPGYPDDLCGGNGVYGYLEISQFRPSGTASAGMGIIQTEEPPALTSAPMTTEMSIETEVMQSSVRSTVTSPSSTSTSDSTASSSFSSSGPPQSITQRPTVETVTVGGTVRTVTTTPQATAGHDTGLREASASTGLAGGAIAGIVVGVIGGLLALAAFLFLLWKKRRPEDGEKGFVSPMRGGSSSGMTGISKGPMVATDPLGWEAKRRSHLMPVDPRLDPFAKGIYSQDPNRSHDSISSLQDNHDYSRRVTEAPRVLRAVNPDPDVH